MGSKRCWRYHQSQTQLQRLSTCHLVQRERKNSCHSLLPKLHPRTVELQRSKLSSFILLGSVPLLLTSFSGTRENHLSFNDFSQSADTWSDIVGVVLTEEGSIDHDSTLDRNLNDLPFFHEKGVSVVLKVVQKMNRWLCSTRLALISPLHGWYARGNAARLTICLALANFTMPSVAETSPNTALSELRYQHFM